MATDREHLEAIVAANNRWRAAGENPDLREQDFFAAVNAAEQHTQSSPETPGLREAVEALIQQWHDDDKFDGGLLNTIELKLAAALDTPPNREGAVLEGEVRTRAGDPELMHNGHLRVFELQQDTSIGANFDEMAAIHGKRVRIEITPLGESGGEQ